MKRILPPFHSVFLLRTFVLAVSIAAVSTATASLPALQALIANPSDGGPGPGIWLSTNGTNNLGSDRPGPPPEGLATFTMSDAQADFFGNANGAFALRTQDGEGNPTTGSAGISGSGSTTYLTGNNSTLVFTFKTPSTFSTVSLVERGPDNAANSFELVLLNTGVLRLSYRNTTSSDRVNLQTLVPDTWYYVAIKWDLSDPTNNLHWYVGQMGSTTLASGSVTATAVGMTNSAIRIAGRANSLLNFQPYQNIAIYDRTLSAGAIQDQFGAITERLRLLSERITEPADGGFGPAIWYATSGLVNSGSGAASLTTFTLDRPTTDFFGNPSLAFGLRDSAVSGAGISGSGSTPYASGERGSVIMTFLTPETLANASLFSRGQFSVPPNFELFLFADTSQLRLTLAEQEATDFAVVAPNTWYYLAVTWDTTLINGQVTWYFGELQSAPEGLTTGTITASAVGNPAQSIFIGGRPGTAAQNFTGFFQNIAIYERTLAAVAVEEQFAVFEEPEVIPGAVAVRLVDGAIEVEYSGILQESEDLTNWTDLVPQPASPAEFPIAPGDKRFFRARSTP